jgi:hypothetical protein
MAGQCSLDILPQFTHGGEKFCYNVIAPDVASVLHHMATCTPNIAYAVSAMT